MRQLGVIASITQVSHWPTTIPLGPRGGALDLSFAQVNTDGKQVTTNGTQVNMNEHEWTQVEHEWSTSEHKSNTNKN